MRSQVRLAALVAVVCSLVYVNAAPASARKVANPGAVTFTVQTGAINVKTNSFSFDQDRPPQCSDGTSNEDASQDTAVDYPADPQCTSAADDSEAAAGFQAMTPITLTGTIDQADAVNVPAAGIVFPVQYLVVSGDVITVRIQPLSAATGSLNPLNGAASFDLHIRVKLEGSPSGVSLGNSCFISPIDIVPLTTGTSGAVSGIPYDASTGDVTVANGTLFVPGASGCGTFGIANGPINDALGLPSASGQNTAVLGLNAFPLIVPAITANLTASPGTSGQAPFAVTFNAAGSSATAGISNYQFDFTNNGSTDATVTPPNTTAPFTYTSPGSYTARLRVTDTQGDFVEKTLPITVGVNLPPTANPQTVSTNEDTSTPITLTGSDPTNDPLTFTVVPGTGPTHGSLSGTAPNLTYAPNGGYFGGDSFQFRVSDTSGNTSAPATVTINVLSVNDAPSVSDLSVSTAEDASVGFTVSASDPEGDTLAYSTSGGPAHGTLTGSGPSYTYAPDANFTGSDPFTVTVDDGHGGTDSATVSITVTPVNDPPVANNQTVSTNQDEAVAITLDVTDVDGPAQNIAITGPPSHGSLSGTAPNLTYTPNSGYFGPDSFSYAVTDGAGGSDTATVSISVSQPGNDAPVANDQTVTTPEDTSVTFALDASDPNGDPLTVTIDTGPDHGTLTGSGLSRTYTPDTGFGADDSFTYTVDDGRGGFDSATVTIDVQGVNDPPTASAQLVTTDEDTSVPVVLNASDPDGDSLSYDVDDPAHGTLSGTAPNLVYAPDPQYHGLDSVTYEACDPSDACVSSGVSVRVTSVPDAPVAADQSVSTNEDTQVSFSLQATDADEDALTITITDAPDHGALTGTGLNRKFTPTANANGGDSITYQACDPTNRCDTATITITIVPVNDAPTTQNQGLVTAEDSSIGVTLVGGDVDGDAITFTLSSHPTHGSLSGSIPNLTYTPTPNFFGNDSFGYAVNDGHGGTASAVVNIGVYSVQDTPVATPQTVTTAEDTALAILLKGTDGDGDALQFFVERGPLHGSLVGAPPNVTYRPALDYTGADNFEFTARDTTGRSSARATVGITVTPAVPIPTKLVAQPAVVGLAPLRITRGFEAKLTRTDTNAALPSQRVDFYVGTTKRCSALTDATGTAKCQPAPASVATASKYEARYLGTADYAPSSTEAPITKVT